LFDSSQRGEKGIQDEAVGLVERAIGLASRLGRPVMPLERELLATELRGVETRLDRIVYELYGMDGKDVEVVEGLAERGSAEEN
jgi:hypothetical protein